MSRIPRRQFLSVLAAGGAGVAVAPWLDSASRRGGTHRGGVNAPTTATQHRVTRTAWALGSTVTVTALHAEPAQAAAGLDAAFAELETVEQVMSIYRPKSQLSRLNRDGVYHQPHPYLVEVLQAATDMSRRTQGAFDVTIQPLWQTYWAAHQQGTRPRAADLDAARGRVDWQHVEVTSQRIRLHGADTAVTLNGLAQGYAADRAAIALRRHGVQQALIDTGEFGALGRAADQDGWRVGIEHPRREDSLVAVAQLAGRCLATSGDYATRFNDSFTTHHLLDPRTGRSAGELSSVSIVAATGLAADALSTAVFVLGFEQGRALVAATPGADALFVSKDGRSWTSPEFPLHETA